jgi:hypothetical protein
MRRGDASCGGYVLLGLELFRGFVEAALASALHSNHKDTISMPTSWLTLTWDSGYVYFRWKVQEEEAGERSPKGRPPAPAAPQNLFLTMTTCSSRKEPPHSNRPLTNKTCHHLFCTTSPISELPSIPYHITTFLTCDRNSGVVALRGTAPNTRIYLRRARKSSAPCARGTPCYIERRGGG